MKLNQTYSLADLNQMSQAEFVDVLGEVFEHTPTIAQQSWEQRPFATLADLHQCMVNLVRHFPLEQQLALIRAHPDLGAKTQMAESSVQEQAGVGLDRLTAEEFDRFQSFNQAYKAKFGFPFLIAVKHHTKASILAAFEQRLHHSVEQEQEQALNEIFQIAWFRLNTLVTHTVD
jgi:2-oxo-4-hydroxy-4-carboxy-5-ureidoimidazoline decarboxylase